MTDQPPGGLLRAIVGTLETLGIRYMVVGSFASTAYGEPRSTRVSISSSTRAPSS